MAHPISLPFGRGTVMTEAQRRQYAEQGFFVVRNLVQSQKLQQYIERFKKICRDNIKVPGMTVMKDVALVKTGASGEYAVNKFQDFQYDPELFDFCELPQIVEYMKDILDSDNIMAMHTMLINKPPDPGTKTSRHPMHQDLHYFPFRPADRISCAWTALEPVTIANGCLVVVPGTHRGSLLPHEYPDWEGGVNKMYHGIQNFDQSAPRTHLEMGPGDTVFFHPLLIHGSGANNTKGFRKAISCHYAAAECYYIDVRGTTQENISEEVKQLAKSKFGQDIEISFEDAWRYRARLVAGQKCNL